MHKISLFIFILILNAGCCSCGNKQILNRLDLILDNVSNINYQIYHSIHNKEQAEIWSH